MRIHLGLVAAMALISGCTYISADQLQQRKDDLDEDGDGVKSVDDCIDVPVDVNPYSGQRFPGNTPDTPYDGIDADCNRLDVVDLDGDRYPGISYGDWYAAFSVVAAAWHDDESRPACPASPVSRDDFDELKCWWPPDVRFDGSVDCNDEDATIFPGSTSERPYDAVDSNCDGGDDFDADGDGFASAKYADTYTGSLPATDCDDSDADVHPGASGDVPYDGVDTDCDGKNDFDVDGDGYIARNTPRSGSNDAGWKLRFDQFREFYGYEYTVNGYDDCVDGVEGLADPDTMMSAVGFPTPSDPMTATVRSQAASIHPGATEIWNDGIDQDCDPNTEFDEDRDGWVETARQADVEDYLDTYSHADFNYSAKTSGVSYGECDDLDFTVHPWVLEVLGDGVDQDCDGSDDGGVFNDGGYSWDGAYPPRAAITDDLYLFAAIADANVSDTGAPTTAPGVVFAWEIASSPGYGARWTAVPTFGGSLGFGPGLQVEADGSDFYLGVSNISSLGDRAYISPKRYYPSSSGTGYSIAVTNQSVKAAAAYDGIDTQLAADGVLWTAGCNDAALHVATVPTASGFTRRAGAALTDVGTLGTSCWIDGFGADSADVCVTGPTAAVRCFTATEDLVASTITFTEITGGRLAYRSVVRNGAWTAFTSSTGVELTDGVKTHSLLSGKNVLRADGLVLDSGELYLAAVVDEGSGNELVLVYGSPSSPNVSTIPVVTMDGVSITPSTASLTADADRVMVVVSGKEGGSTGRDNAIAWVFLIP